MISVRPLKKEKKFTGTNDSLVFYPPRTDFFPAQEGPVCYHYSLLRMMQYHRQNYEDDIPECCKLIVNDILSISKNTFLADDVDDIFRDRLTVELIGSLDIPSKNDEDPIDAVEDFMDEFSHSQAMALLLGMRLVQTNFTNMSFDQLRHYLKKCGPMVFDGGFDLMPIANLTLLTKLVHDNITAYTISSTELNEIQHAVLVVGCKQDQSEVVFYIDPNYPDRLFAIPFGDFKKRVVDSGNGLICHPINQLQPIVVERHISRVNEAILPIVSGAASAFFPTSIPNHRKRKLVDEVVNTENKLLPAPEIKNI